MAFWLLKSEPGAYAWADLVRDGETAWTGVRNFEARNHLRAMKRGDRCLFYHSMEGKSVVGVAQVVREAYADPTAEAGDWSAVDVAPVAALHKEVTLDALREALPDMAIFRRNRLSVVPVTKQEWDAVLKLGKTRLARR